MSNLIVRPIWRDMLTLRDTMDKLFDESFARNGGSLANAASVHVDIEAKPDEFVLRANVPGLKPDDLHIEIVDNTVTLRGEFKAESKNEQDSYLLVERQYGQFTRSFTLPVSLDSTKAEARIENGLLTLRLPKAEAVKPKTITIKAK